MKPALRIIVDNSRELRRLALTRYERQRWVDDARFRRGLRNSGLLVMLATLLLGALFAFCGCAQSGAQIF